MADMITQGEKNLILLRRLFPGNDRLYLWCCMPDGRLLASDCPDGDLYQTILRAQGGMDRIIEHGQARDHPRPLLTGTAVGLQWAAAYECDAKGATRLIFLLGPAFYYALSNTEVEDGLKRYSLRELSLSYREDLIRRADQVPVMTASIFTRCAVMLHNALNQEQLMVSDLENGDSPLLSPVPAQGKRDRHRVWMAEKALLSMVKNGDLDYQEALQNSTDISSGVPVHGRDPLTQARISSIVFTSLVVRAAMEGGLSPEEAYSLGDSYIQAIEDSRDPGELSALVHTMYDDFICRVHRCRTNPNYSRQIQKCCDYIQTNLDKPVRTGDLAALAGYSDYYLSEKFKKETGMSISDYVRRAKVERAQILLVSTDLTVQQISEKLGFNTPNYFIESFRKLTGCTPAQYRRREQA